MNTNEREKPAPPPRFISASIDLSGVGEINPYMNFDFVDQNFVRLDGDFTADDLRKIADKIEQLKQ